MKRFSFLLLFALPLFSFAQSNYVKGYVVTNKYDTLRGYIDYKESDINLSSIRFKFNEGDDLQVFTTKNCAAFGIADMDAYERYKVDISKSFVDAGRLSRGADSRAYTDTVFLEVLVKGRYLDLFLYKDKIKTRFYLKDADSNSPYELSRQVFLDPTDRKDGRVGVVITNDKYKSQLFAVMKRLNISSPVDEKRLESLSYNENSLVRIVTTLNGQQLEKSKYPKSRFFAGAGLNVTNTKYVGDNDLANAAAKSKTSYLPALTAGVDLFANPAIGRLIFRIELSLLMSQNDISTVSKEKSVTVDNTDPTFVRHTFDQYTVALTPQVIYNIYNTTKLKVFAGGGAGLNLSAYGNNKYTVKNTVTGSTTEGTIDFEPVNLYFPVTAGIVLNKKIEILAGYTMYRSLINYIPFTIKMERFKIGVNYLFGH